MSFELLFDPLFRVPFATGLLLAAILPLIGMYLRLRNEWLAALAFAQMASAGALVAMVLDGPMLAAACWRLCWRRWSRACWPGPAPAPTR
jgi:zinc transport system permease protein